MLFRETSIPGAFEIEAEPVEDERGLFARTFDAEAFAEHGLSTQFSQCSTSYNRRASTVRGLHYQAAPHQECKLIRCTAGAVFDVLVDLRPDSPVRCRWHAVELTSERRNALYAPAGVAHGFQTLEDASEVFYMIDVPFEPAAARGVRWDDPRFGIEWPEPHGPRTISERDRSYPDYSVAGEASP